MHDSLPLVQLQEDLVLAVNFRLRMRNLGMLMLQYPRRKLTKVNK